MCDNDCNCCENTDLPVGPKGDKGPQGPPGTAEIPIDLNYVAKGTGTSVTESQIFDNAINVGINTITPSAKLHIKGDSILESGKTFKTSNDDDINTFIVDNAGNILIGETELDLSATDGFLYISTCPGTPVGIPTIKLGILPLVIDSINDNLYLFSSGSWHVVGGWSLFGNVGIDDTTNFIGTSDAVNFNIRTNNIQRASFLSDGQINFLSTKIGIGSSIFTPKSLLDVRGQIIAGDNDGTGSPSSDAPFKAIKASTGSPNFRSGLQYEFEVGGGAWGIGFQYSANAFQFLTPGSPESKFTFGSGTSAAPTNAVVFETSADRCFVGIGHYSGNYNFELRSHAESFTHQVATFDDLSGSAYLRILKEGYLIQKIANAVYASGSLNNSQMVSYIDEAANNFIIKVKYSTGTVKTATIPLI